MKFTASKLFSLFTLLAVSASFSVSARGVDDWPHWRGPNRNDISSEKGLLKSWPKQGPSQIWINQKCGLGYAGFAVVGEHLFTMGLEDGNEFALCLNSNDGSELWRKKIDSGETKDRGGATGGWGDGSRSTPSVDGDLVYFMSAGGALTCLNKSDGKKVWAVRMQDFGGSVPKWGFAESPLVDEDKVICTPGGSQGTVLALNKRTGKKIWQTKAVTMDMDGTQSKPAEAHYSSVLPVDWNNRRQYIQLTVLAAIGIDAESGDVLWQSDWPGRVAVIPSPIFDEGKVYITSGYGVGSKLIEIDGDNNAEQVWYSRDMQNHHGGVVKVGDYFYGYSDKKGFVCQNEVDGKMIWNDKKIKKGAVTFADGLFYHLQESDGKVLLIRADENSHEVLGSFKLSPQTKRNRAQGKIWAHPTIANGKLYLRDQDIIYCYNVKN